MDSIEIKDMVRMRYGGIAVIILLISRLLALRRA